MNRLLLIIIVIMGALFVFPCSGFTLTTEFQGHLESKYITRDTSGFQYGFMDDLDSVQWKQEMQLDFTVRPEYIYGQPAFRFQKAFFRYRGAYDAIFDTTDRYDDIRKKSPADFELGRDDLKWENDLREAFADFIGEDSTGSTRANLRLGRQIVQWGEADGFNLMNIINPNDNSSKMFFSNPEDLLTPLWMGRFDVKVPGTGFFENFDLQVLAIPDIRPTQYAPLDGQYNAPYAFGFKGFSPLVVKEDVPDNTLDNMEYGVRAGTSFAGLNLFLYYFDGWADNGAVDFSTAATGSLFFRHEEQQAYGFSFNKFIETGNFVLRGEGSLTTDYTVVDFEDPTFRGYTFHDFYQALVGFDKSISGLPIGTRSALTTAFQVYYAKIDDYDENALFGRTADEDNVRLTLLLTTDYVHGTIVPTVFGMYDTEGTWMTQLGVAYSPDGHWYFDVTQMSFWGNHSATSKSAFAPFVKTASEVAVKCGYRW